MRRELMLLGLLGACHHAPQAQAGPAQGPVITLERTPCYGGCPIYRVELHADGAVRFVGERFTKVTGEATGRVPADSVKALMAAFEAAKFTTLPDTLTFGSPACPERITDLPSAIVTLTKDGRTKRVIHQGGCRGAPPALDALEKRIDAVTGTERWIGAR